MRRVIYTVIILTLIFLPISQADAKEMVTLKVDNCVVLGLEAERNYFIDSSSNRLMIPMSLAMEALQVRYINYNKETKERVFKFLGYEIKLAVGSKTAYVNNKKVILDVAPLRKEDVYEMMFFPIRLLIDHCDLKVDWNSNWKELTISDNRIYGPDNLFFYPMGNDIVTIEKEDKTPIYRVASYMLPNQVSDTKIHVSLQNISGKDIKTEPHKVRYFTGSNFYSKYYTINDLKNNEDVSFICDTGIDYVNNSFFSLVVDY